MKKMKKIMRMKINIKINYYFNNKYNYFKYYYFNKV